MESKEMQVGAVTICGVRNCSPHPITLVSDVRASFPHPITLYATGARAEQKKEGEAEGEDTEKKEVGPFSSSFSYRRRPVLCDVRYDEGYAASNAMRGTEMDYAATGTEMGYAATRPRRRRRRKRVRSLRELRSAQYWDTLCCPVLRWLCCYGGAMSRTTQVLPAVRYCATLYCPRYYVVGQYSTSGVLWRVRGVREGGAWAGGDKWSTDQQRALEAAILCACVCVSVVVCVALSVKEGGGEVEHGPAAYSSVSLVSLCV
eukprot:674602-Rhodomonas_salina.2